MPAGGRLMPADLPASGANRAGMVGHAGFSRYVPDPERRVIEQQSQDVALRMLGGLPKRDREVLVRFYLQEQTVDEICRDLDLTETQFRLIKSRAKARYGELGRRRFALRSGFRVK